MLEETTYYTNVLSIVGDILKIRARDVGLGDLAVVNNWDGDQSLAQVIGIDNEDVSLQVFTGGKGLSTEARVRFLGHPSQVTYSDNILGRVFDGAGAPIDSGPRLDTDPRVDIGGPSVNPVKRIVPKRMIETRIPMIDVFNCLVESQKIPIFSVAGEPYNKLLARIGIQADAEIIVFGGMGLIFDDYHFFRSTFESEGIFARTVMFVNQASDPIVERILVPDMALKVAERFAVEMNKRVLVLLTDMTAYADALKEIGISMERVPATRGYMGDLYSQLAVRYERACDYQGAGSVTILTVTTMPGDDVTHPVPDNTGYITEGHPFGSLSRLNVLLIADSTSRWAQAMRETSGRLEEIPGEEAFPAYLDSSIKAVYERAGVVRTNDGTEGSLTMIGTVSPAGGNFEEPVTQSTLGAVKCFLGLSSERAYKRFYPAIDPLLSWSRYLDQLQPQLDSELDPEWTESVKRMTELLHRGDSVYQMMQVTGEEGVTLDDYLDYQRATLLDMVYLQQDAFDPVDVSVSTERQKESFQLLLRLIDREYRFTDKEQIREYFTQLTGLYKNLNYAEWNSQEYNSLIDKIAELERGAMTGSSPVESSAGGK